MSLIPVGFSEVTFKLRPTGGSRIATWSIGVDDSVVVDPNPAVTALNFYTYASETGGPYKATAMSSDWTFVGVHVTQMQEVGPLGADYDNPIVGTATAAQTPVNTSLLVDKRTGIGNRRNRGRCYPPPTMIAESQINNLGAITATLSTVQAYFDHIKSAAAVGDYQLVLFHQTPPFTPTPITSLVVQPLVATQRRRMRR